MPFRAPLTFLPSGSLGPVRFLLSLLLVLVCASSSCPQQPSASSIRVEVSRVNVGVIVTDARGKFVEGLQRPDFHVFDDGKEQAITEFAPIEEPAQVLLLLEAGPAVYLLGSTHLLVADALLSGLAPGDKVAIVRYQDAAAGILGFTSDTAAARAALEQIQFNLGLGELNLSTSLNTVLDWLANTPGKKTIVLLSTGVDTSPPDSAAAVDSRLLTGDVRVLCVSLTGPLRSGKRGNKRVVQETQQAFDEADTRLRAIAEATGGRAFFPENPKALQETYRQVAQLVRNEYSLAFALPAADGAVHSIDVQVDSAEKSAKQPVPEYRIDHRRAYRAPKPEP